MIKGERILALIPARGGSKEIPRKNMKILGGKTLVEHTIDQAKGSKYIDKIVISSDDKEIIAVAQKAGCEAPFVRPSNLATDTAPTIDVITHCLTKLPDYDFIVLLQPTSPFRTTQDIDSCIEKCIYRNAPSCVSVTEPDKSPYWMYTTNQRDELKPILKTTGKTRRQDLPQAVALNGAVYVAKCSSVLEHNSLMFDTTVAYIMSQQNSIDIDTLLDFLIAEAIINNKTL